MTDPVYLDAAASTPIAPEALAATVAALQQAGNPGAAHMPGRSAAALVERAREVVGALVRVGPAAVTFVGSATEANNLALRGLLLSSDRDLIVTTTVDHPSVRATLDDLQSAENSHRRLPVTSEGEVDLSELADGLTSRTALVSVQAANNETGVVQPLHAIAAMAHEVGALVHADASQLMAWGATSLLDECDLVTVSSHKMHGPQGAAALVVRPAARDQLRPQITGGGQEHGLRSGTVNVAAVAGFGAAAELALDSGPEAAQHVRDLRLALLDGLTARIHDIVEHGARAAERLPGILNVAIGTKWTESIESAALLARLPLLAASTGSACHAGTPEPSPVLRAMGVSEWEAARSLRLSLSRYTTGVDVETAIVELARGYDELRQLLGTSPSDERCAV